MDVRVYKSFVLICTQSFTITHLNSLAQSSFPYPSPKNDVPFVATIRAFLPGDRDGGLSNTGHGLLQNWSSFGFIIKLRSAVRRGCWKFMLLVVSEMLLSFASLNAKKPRQTRGNVPLIRWQSQ